MSIATTSEAAIVSGTDAIVGQVVGGRGGPVVALLGLGLCLLALLAHGLIRDTYVAGTDAGVQFDGFFDGRGIEVPWDEIESLEAVRAKGRQSAFHLTWRLRTGEPRRIKNGSLYGQNPEAVARLLAVHRERGVTVVD